METSHNTTLKHNGNNLQRNRNKPQIRKLTQNNRNKSQHNEISTTETSHKTMKLAQHNRNKPQPEVVSNEVKILRYCT